MLAIIIPQPDSCLDGRDGQDIPVLAKPTKGSLRGWMYTSKYLVKTLLNQHMMPNSSVVISLTRLPLP